MPKITNFMFCKEPNGESIKPIQAIQIDRGNSEFSIVFSLIGINPAEDHSGYVVLSTPNDKVILETEKYELPARSNEDSDQDIISGVSIGMNFGVEFETTGLHKAELYFNNKKIGEFFIPVIRQGSEE